MKKAMKLVWMVLLALPMISLTSCGDDDDTIMDDNGVEVQFKDYSNLLGKTMTDILNKEMKDYTPEMFEDGSGMVYYSDDQDLGDNVFYVSPSFWLYGADEEVVYQSEKSVMVLEEVYGFEKQAMYNHFSSKYGDATMLSDGTYEFTKGNMYIWLDYISKNEIDIYYVNKSDYDKYVRETKGTDSVAAIKKALKAHVVK